ncbi:MAG TPA: OsmC family protein [Steroidobacteraceae bacterium]|jgi:organic hydroperoxide reductase OsmC/OhrA|nr:OsmC family protein [Steroidobacteraceae bacterium]
MSDYTAEVIWQRGEANFLDNRYSRAHRWHFDGGIDVPGSSSPHSVPLPWSDPAAVDPEEAFVAALSSCHMLWFLSIAAKRRFCVDHYRDLAVGTLGQNAERQWCVTVVTLRPEVRFSGTPRPTPADIESMHHAAHEQCFIAHSVTSEVRCEPIVSE